MDRPEGFTANPVTGRVYAVMTKNAKREPGDENAPNPRAKNAWGHILELIPPGAGKDADHAADEYGLGHPPARRRSRRPGRGCQIQSRHQQGRLAGHAGQPLLRSQGSAWICTDGANDFDFADGVYACDTEGEGRALTRLFFACPSGAEATGACFTPDGRALFVSVQHPGENSETLAEPTTRWPTMDPAMPPMPAVVVVTRQGGGEIGA